MRLTIIIILFLLLAGVQGASAHFTIDEQKFIVDGNGTRIFPVGVYNMCHYTADYYAFNPSCIDSIELFGNATYSEQTLIRQDLPTNWTFFDMTIAAANAAGMYMEQKGTSDYRPRNDNWSYFTYFQAHAEQKTAAAYDDLRVHYDFVKSFDTDHPVKYEGLYWNTDPYDPATPENVSTFSDIFEDATYTYKTNCFPTNQFGLSFSNASNCAQLYWYVDDWLYARERFLRQKVLDGSTTGSGLATLEDLPIPVWMLFSATTKPYNESTNYNTDIKPWNKYRTEAYWAVTVGARGWGYWASKVITNTSDEFLAANITHADLFNNFIGELTSDKIQNIITMNTTNNSWKHYDYLAWDEKVNFSNNPVKTILGNKGLSLTYILYNDSVNDTDYLIAVNKNNVSISTTITIAGMSGIRNGTLLGLYGTGSAISGRQVVFNDGVLEETFDPYAAHIYEISSESAPPSGNATTWTIRGSGGDAMWSDYWYEGKP